ncbi:MAG: EF-hand domain-containing protein [Planctomycetaceae bacterium]|nr:EF-hand domain-containing protein [Planctomycetaceae bacterium]
MAGLGTAAVGNGPAVVPKQASSENLSMKKVLVGLTALNLFVGVCALPTTVSADDKPKVTPEQRFKRADKNKDGKLSFEEFKGKQTDEEKAKKAFDRKDKDKDGSLTLEEFSAVPKKKSE